MTMMMMMMHAESTDVFFKQDLINFTAARKYTELQGTGSRSVIIWKVV